MSDDANQIKLESTKADGLAAAPRATKSENGRQWLSDIECLKGLAILFVVWGHVYDPAFPVWALNLRSAIYAFHMPLFMFVSGYVFIHVGAHNVKGSLATYTKSRAIRLLLPFIVMAVIVVFGKLMAGLFLRVDKPIGDITKAFSLIFVNTEKSPVLFIWYLIILFYFSIMTAFIHSVLKINLWIIILVSLFMQIAHVFLFYKGIVIDILYFNRILFYYIFFIAGCVAYLHKETWLHIVDRYWPVAGIVFISLEYFLLASEWRYLLVGSVSMIFFHGLVRRFLDGNPVMTFLGKHTFSIYLFNMLFIGLVKGIFGKIAPPADYPLLFIILSVVVAVSGSVAIKYLISRFDVLKPVYKAIS